ncbi:MAG: hypothetical protein LIV24_05660 [Eubacterium sp.]|nr:hypothetical protein [Eubacterium sp.]
MNKYIGEITDLKLTERQKMLRDPKSEEAWGYVSGKAGLTKEEAGMAKRLGKTPLDILRMIPNRHERWKDLPGKTIRKLYQRRFR